jgi:energy-coupling factor transport system substrate-specific component
MNSRNIVFSASFIALNLLLGKLAATLSLPVYLDTVGTIIAAVMLPWRYAVLVGVGTSLIAGVVIHPSFPFYAFTQATVATVIYLLAKKNWFSAWPKAVCAGLLLALIAAIVSAPVTVVVFGGVTLSGTTALNAVFMAAGKNVWQAVVTGSLLVESIDKVSACVIAWLVLRRLPQQILGQKQ